MISDVTVRELQYEKEKIDLFFKTPVTIDKIDTMYEAITSAKTASVQIGIDGDDSLVIENASMDDDGVPDVSFPEDDDEEEGLVLDGDDDSSLEMDLGDEVEEIVALEVDATKVNNVVDLAKELEGIEGGILGVDNVESQDNTQGEDLMSLLEGSGETEVSGQYDSQDISRILKSEVLVDELNREKEAQNANVLAEMTVVKESHDFGILDPEERPGKGLDLLVDPGMTRTMADPDALAPQREEGPRGVSAEEVQKMLRHREEDYMKLLSRNEILEEENRIIREKVVSLEEVASSASLNSKKKSLESDENKIKISVLRRHHSEEVERLKDQNKLYYEKLSYYKENMERLTSENKSLLKKNLVDVKQIHSREEELEEKIQLMKADISSQIKNRENKIIELKRKIDLLQFDLKDSEEREKEHAQKIALLEEKLYKLKKVLGESIERLDESFIEHPALKVKI